MSNDLAEFLLARIADDEQVARDTARFVGGAFGNYNVGGQAHVVRELWHHANRWTPARVLAECEAKRQIVAVCEGYRLHSTGLYRENDEHEQILRLLALPYADHPAYREEWRP